MKENISKRSASYRFDAFLMHLIQDVTKKPSAEILNFFYELAGQVIDIGIEKRTGRGFDKKIVDYFPGTSIPFYMRIKGHERQPYNYTTRQYEGDVTFSSKVELTFPAESSFMNEQQLADIAVGLMERALLGGEEVVVAAFAKPEIKSPKMYQKLMSAFVGRPEPEKKSRKKKENKEEADETIPARES